MSMALIIGAGRSCSTWTMEIVKASRVFTHGPGIDYMEHHSEDRGMFQRDDLPDGYCNKLTTEHAGFTYNNVIKFFEKYPSMKIIFCIRHPVDHCMAKMARGSDWPGVGYGKADDGTLDGSTASITRAMLLFNVFNTLYKHRLLVVRQEDLITDTENQINRIASFIGGMGFIGEIGSIDAMLNAFKNDVNEHHVGSGNTMAIQHDRMDLWKNWKTVYNGFFTNNPEIIRQIYHRTKYYCHVHNYLFDERVLY